MRTTRGQINCPQTKPVPACDQLWPQLSLAVFDLEQPSGGGRAEHAGTWAQLALGWASGRSRGAPAELGCPGSCPWRRPATAVLPFALCSQSQTCCPLCFQSYAHPVLSTACGLCLESNGDSALHLSIKDLITDF